MFYDVILNTVCVKIKSTGKLKKNNHSMFLYFRGEQNSNTLSIGAFAFNQLFRRTYNINIIKLV